MGSQYSVPISHVASSGAVYGANSANATDMMIVNGARDRKEKTNSQEGNSDNDRTNENNGYEFGQITPPASELLLTVRSCILFTQKRIVL